MESTVKPIYPSRDTQKHDNIDQSHDSQQKPSYPTRASNRTKWYILAVTTAIAIFWFTNSNPISLFTKCHKSGGVSSLDWTTLAPGTVHWEQCQGVQPNSSVPTDYFNSSVGVTKVALSRWKASRGPRGPGGPGKSFVVYAGPSLQAVTGYDYDVVGFDPRGIGETEPAVKCFPDGYGKFAKNTILDRSFDDFPNASEPQARERLLLQQYEAEALYQTQFEMCERTMGDKLKYMGTTTVVRDIDFITTVLDGSEASLQVSVSLLSLSSKLLSLLEKPYYEWYQTWMKFSWNAYEFFFSECSKAGPPSCALAHEKGEDPTVIRGRVEAFFASLYHHPLPVPDANPPSILTEGRAKIPPFEGMATPTEWPSLARILNDAMNGNATELLDASRILASDLGRSGVSCNDNIAPRNYTAEDVVDHILYNLKNVSPFASTIVTTEPDAGCAYWPFSLTPSDRFTGPFNNTLSNRILILSNLMDPVTPMTSGEYVKSLLEDSAVLALRKGPGHCSSSLPSRCIANITRAYFNDGTLPNNLQLCDYDGSIFPHTTEVHEQKFAAYSDEDTELLEHIHLIDKHVKAHRRIRS
ncbi:hypothetical protein Clacol_008966 [Clathrus columnatus]|uniref:Peptidase S33 tripeptidyl aminopeptidase-like C-terminal domain-containing protein n=1 Tax=Clathrus columnatus TaxID=1419009 RepID=A0AAV5AJ76_9AGAM|nr:hypothetical protein Clacol_008966 [Clathrus columnatus]